MGSPTLMWPNCVTLAQTPEEITQLKKELWKGL